MQEQLTMNRPKGHHLTLKERGNIEVLFNHYRNSRRKIVDLIGVSAQTINNGIKRGLVTNKQLVNGSGLSRSKVFSGLKSLIAAGKVEVLGASVSTAYRAV